MGSITKGERLDKATGRKVVVYRAYVRRAGVSKSKVFRTSSEAKAWLRENEHDLALADAAKSHSKTLGDLIEDFVLEPSAPGRKYWAPQHLEFWKDQIGGLPIREVSRKDVNAALATLRTMPARRGGFGGVKITGTTLSAGTVNRYLATLSSVFNFALEREIIDDHPMKGGKVKKLKESNGRRRILSPDEEARLMAAAEASTWPMLALFVRLCLTTAARRSEALRLRWRDVNLDESVAILPTSKNDRPRALPLVADVRAAFEAAKKVKPLHSDWVFFDPKNPAKPKSIASEWKTCRINAGLYNDRDDPLERVVLHTTRHTAVTRMIKGGANLAQAAAVSGHQTLAMLKRYEHLAASDAVEIAQRLLAGNGAKQAG
jgi:integrase